MPASRVREPLAAPSAGGAAVIANGRKREHRSRAGEAEAAAARSLWLILAGTFALGCLAFAVQSTVWQTTSDTSWLMTVIDRMHAGDRLYVDVIELNPPSSIWLYLAPVHLSYLTGISAEVLARAYTLLIAAAGVAMTGWIVRAGRLMPARAMLPAMAALFVAATILVGNAFSQRDHIGAVLLTPLIALAAWRTTGASPGPRPWHWLAAGVAGGVIAVVRPYYAIVVVATAAYVVVRRRDIRLLFLPEFVLAGALCVAYMAAFYLAYPVYFEKLLPFLEETYLAFSWPLSVLAPRIFPWLALAAAYWLLHRCGGRSVLADLLMACSVAALVPYFVQGKGWAYHSYPAVYLGSAAVIVAASGLLFGRPALSGERTREAKLAGFAPVAVLAAHLLFFEHAFSSSGLAAATKAQTSATPSIGMLDGNIDTGHPLTRMIGGRWIEPYCSDWIAIFALRMQYRAESRGDMERAGHFQDMYKRYLADKRERLMRSPPEILIVNEDDRLVAKMLGEEGFAALLERYTKIAFEDGVAVYRLKAASSPAAASG